ncbi:MAG: nitrous oxide-stimulated promoter family protein [Rikenellaceae bacterium]
MGNTIKREKQIVTQMVELHCRAKHNQPTLCSDCKMLVDYANRQLDRCRYGENKPVCNRCTTHCYKPQMRNKITEVMRYSGRRMILHSPVGTLWHLWRMVSKV